MPDSVFLVLVVLAVFALVAAAVVYPPLVLIGLAFLFAPRRSGRRSP